jgi:hypothetical protein
MYVFTTKTEVVFCQVGPTSQKYGKAGCPIYCLYGDGTYSVQCDGAYFRTEVVKLRKPAREYTVQDLWDIVYCGVSPDNV